MKSRLHSFQHIFFKLSEIGGAMMFLGFPVSISLSQFGLLLAALGWLAYKICSTYINKKSQTPETEQKLPRLIDRVLIAGLVIYCAQFASLLINGIQSPAPFEFIVQGLRNETKDVMLIVAAFWTLAYTNNADNRTKALKWLRWSIYILVATGVISIWSRYRLYKLPWLITHNWEVGPGVRFQHHLGTIPLPGFPIHFYMPIGLMNTHLTYAGLLMFAFPGLVLQVLHPYVSDPKSFFGQINRKTNLGNLLLLIFASGTFILNNGRSAMLGAMLASVFGIIWYAFVYWKQKSIRLLPLLILLILTLAIFAKTAPMIHPRLASAVESLFSGQKKHTDHQRNLVWNGSLEMYASSPFLGIGPGHFETRIKKHILEYSARHPYLWTWYSLAQRGHAHNDYLHLLTIAGPLALFAWLVLLGLLLFHILGRLPPEMEFWKFAPISMLAAGFLQCYFQDDEVLLPFWIYTGLILGCLRSKNEKSISN